MLFLVIMHMLIHSRCTTKAHHIPYRVAVLVAHLCCEKLQTQTTICGMLACYMGRVNTCDSILREALLEVHVWKLLPILGDVLLSNPVAERNVKKRERRAALGPKSVNK